MLTLNTVNGIIRAILPAILAFAAGKGWVGEAAAADITSAAIAIAAAVWSVASNRPAAVIKEAADDPEVEKIIAPRIAHTIPSDKVVDR